MQGLISVSSFVWLAGDGPEERECARLRGWPFVQVTLSMNKQDKAAGRRLTNVTAEELCRKAYS